jgi:hypothetical protein
MSLNILEIEQGSIRIIDRDGTKVQLQCLKEDIDKLPLKGISSGSSCFVLDALEIALTKILVRFVGKPFIYVIPHNPSASADIDTFFNSAKEICEKYGVPVVDIRKAGCMPRIYTLSGKTDGTSAFTQDGVHPNPLGYQLHYVPAIASTLKSIM